jgi:hypothetical protein
MSRSYGVMRIRNRLRHLGVLCVYPVTMTVGIWNFEFGILEYSNLELWNLEFGIPLEFAFPHPDFGPWTLDCVTAHSD